MIGAGLALPFRDGDPDPGEEGGEVGMFRGNLGTLGYRCEK